MTRKESNWGSDRVKTRVAALRDSANRQRQAAKEFHLLSQQCPIYGDRIVFRELATRAFEVAHNLERRADAEQQKLN